MSFDLALEPGEQLITNLLFVPSKNQEAFRLAVTDRVIVLLRKKFFAKTDPFYAERIPFRKILDVRIKKVQPYGMWTFAALMILVGGITTFFMFDFSGHDTARSVSGYPPAILVVGLVIPFLTRNRYAIVVKMEDETYSWKQPLLVDKTSGDQVRLLLNQFASAVREAHLPFTDERPMTITQEAAQSRTSEARSYPMAKVWEDDSKGNCRPCYHCGELLCIPKWDDWNGFLFRCPHCELIHGKSWSPRAIFAGLFFNCLSFFFVLRPQAALSLFAGFVAIIVGWNFLDMSSHEAMWDTIGAFVALGPVAIVAAILVRHQLDLNTSAAFAFKR